MAAVPPRSPIFLYSGAAAASPPLLWCLVCVCFSGVVRAPAPETESPGVQPCPDRVGGCTPGATAVAGCGGRGAAPPTPPGLRAPCSSPARLCNSPARGREGSGWGPGTQPLFTPRASDLLLRRFLLLQALGMAPRVPPGVHPGSVFFRVTQAWPLPLGLQVAPDPCGEEPAGRQSVPGWPPVPGLPPDWMGLENGGIGLSNTDGSIAAHMCVVLPDTHS